MNSQTYTETSSKRRSVIDAAQFERAQRSAETSTFWASVDAHEDYWAREGLDHTPSRIVLP